jgi:hypothetical protein
MVTDMKIDELIPLISKPEIDIEEFVRLSIDEPSTRDEIIHQMLINPDIMVYYHCFYVVTRASQDRPDLFYPYWEALVPLLKHKNSYHRDIALTILANLTAIDDEDRFTGVFADYFEHIKDPKFMTARCCIQNSLKIIRYKPKQSDRIIEFLLDIDQRCHYPEKQKALLKCDVLEVLSEVYQDVADKPEIAAFIKAQVVSLSPKTKKKAKELIRELAL